MLPTQRRAIKFAILRLRPPPSFLSAVAFTYQTVSSLTSLFQGLTKVVNAINIPIEVATTLLNDLETLKVEVSFCCSLHFWGP